MGRGLSLAGICGFIGTVYSALQIPYSAHELQVARSLEREQKYSQAESYYQTAAEWKHWHNFWTPNVGQTTEGYRLLQEGIGPGNETTKLSKLEAALKLEPTNPAVISALAWWHLEHSRFFENETRVFPYELHDKEELQQAITLFNEALDCNPQNIVVHASLGRIYEHQAKNALTREERLEPLRLAHHHYAVVQMFRP